jgi:hypothetical protein
MSNPGILSARRHVRELSTELAIVRKLAWCTSHLADHIIALETALQKIRAALVEEEAK